MTGYLGRLAARASGAGAAVAPRVPSRFEVAGGGASEEAATESDAPRRTLVEPAPSPMHRSAARSWSDDRDAPSPRRTQLPDVPAAPRRNLMR
jgi:hypothetical protein